MRAENDNKDEGVIVTVDQIMLANGQTGERTGIIDVCRSGSGNVHLKMCRMGDQVVIKLPPPLATRLAEILTQAVAEIGR